MESSAGSPTESLARKMGRKSSSHLGSTDRDLPTASIVKEKPLGWLGWVGFCAAAWLVSVVLQIAFDIAGNKLSPGLSVTFALIIVFVGHHLFKAIRGPALDAGTRIAKADLTAVSPSSEFVDHATERTSTSEPIIGEAREEFWSKALAEFNSAERRAGIWAKAFSEAQGNESAAKASYLKYRAVQMEQEHRTLIADRQREAAEKMRSTLVAAQEVTPVAMQEVSASKHETPAIVAVISVAIVLGLCYWIVVPAKEGTLTERRATPECRATKSTAAAFRREFPDEMHGGIPYRDMSDRQLIDMICEDLRSSQTR